MNVKDTQDFTGRRRKWGRARAQSAHDPYGIAAKLKGPARCTGCGAVFDHGRWFWPKPGKTSEADKIMCPACERIEADDPGGLLVIHGGFWQRHRQEISNLLRNVEKADRSNFPLHRIMSEMVADGAMVVAATDPHLVQRMSDALNSAYNGTADIRYDTDDYFVQVNWFRDT